MSSRSRGRRRNSVGETGNASGEDEPSRKQARTRVTKACEECRRRKERCDGKQPRCQRCIKGDRTCSYHQARKRGLRTGYVRGIEMLLGLLVHSFDGAEELIVSVLEKDDRVPEPDTAKGHTSAPQTQSLLELWRKSNASDILRKVLIASEVEEDEESYLQNLDVKWTVNFNTLPRHHLDATHDVTENTARLDMQHPPDTFPQGSTLPVTNMQLGTSDVTHSNPHNSYPCLPPNWSRLIDLYMASTHCWLPIIEKYTLFRSASLINDATNTCNSLRPTPGETTSLWAALAYGSYLAHPVAPGVGSSGVPYSTSHISKFAKGLANQFCECYESGHVHAFLILALLEIAHGAYNNAWLWVGKAIYVAATLGIILFERNPLNSRTSETKKRLFRGCFILDTLVSARLGFRPYLHHGDVKSVGGINVEGLEEWETWNSSPEGLLNMSMYSGPSRILSIFNDLGDLVGILNSSVRATRDGATTIKHRDLLNGFLREKQNVASFSLETPELLTSAPPHLAHLRAVATTIYVVLRYRLHVMAGGQPPNCESHAVLKTLEFLKSTPKISPAFVTSKFPPTIHLLFHLLDQIHASSPEYPLRADWESMEQSTTSSHTAVAKEPGILDPMLFVGPGAVTTVPTPASRWDPADVEPSGTRAPAASNTSPGLGSTVVRQDGTEPLNQTPRPIQSPLQAIQSVPDLSPVAGQLGVSNLDPGRAAADRQSDVEPNLAEAHGESELFSQVSLLDTDDWPVVSEDFMEHLGFSRDGNVVDFQSLISS